MNNIQYNVNMNTRNTTRMHRKEQYVNIFNWEEEKYAKASIHLLDQDNHPEYLHGYYQFSLTIFDFSRMNFPSLYF